MRMSWTRWPLKVPSHPNHFDSMTHQHLFPASLQHAASTHAGTAAGTYLQLGWICNDNGIKLQSKAMMKTTGSMQSLLQWYERTAEFQYTTQKV